jgi:competence protein ComEC
MALLTALLLLVTVRPLAPPADRVWIVMLDVGQGDAIAIGSGGQWRVVDTGPRAPRSDAGERVVLPFLRWAGVRRLAAVALTHDDSDHTGGAAALARGIPVNEWWTPPPWPGVRSPGRGLPVRAVGRGDTLMRAPMLVALWPPRPGATGDWSPQRSLTSPDNDAGLVLELLEDPAPRPGRALFLADVDSTVEESLRVAPGVAWLKVAHHGSASSSGARFLARLHPGVAAISVGRNNRFGHPAPEALARIAASGAAVLRTDEAGALWFELTSAGARRLDWRCDRSFAPPAPPCVTIACAPRAPLRP